MMSLYGNFNMEGTEFIITNPATPRAFDNFLWNDSIFSYVQQTGVGYCDYQVDKYEAVQLLTGNGRICDFDLYGRDNLMSRLIYIRDNDTGDFWNVNWEPVRKKYEEYECKHGLGYTIIKTRVKGIISEFRIFVPKGKDPVELWTLSIINNTGIRKNLSIFIYNQFQFRFKWGFDSYGDMIFRSSWFSKQFNAVVAEKHPHLRPHDYLTGFLTADEPIVAYDGTRDAFVGMYNTLGEPEAVIRGQCTNTPGSADATIGAAQFNLQLNGGESKEISLILGVVNEEKNIGFFRNKYFGNYEKYFCEIIEERKNRTTKNMVKTPDEHFNRMFNYWGKHQALFGATWCRWGWNGYRDIVQHGMGVSSFKPQRTKEILVEAFKHQYNSGLALRGWNPIDKKAYSDSSLWLVFTLISYIKETGDTGFLEEIIPYYDRGDATVLSHIDQALDFLENHKGSHGLCLIKFGDWNDSLTAVGKRGKGESVWLSEAYAEALYQMADLAEYLNNDSKKRDYLERCKCIKDAINKTAWDGNWYIRCFDDNGNPIGTSTNEQGKIFIESQAWALIAGVANSERAKKLIRACDDLLGTDLGYKLLSPTFMKRDENIGRISCLEPGICENSTIYSHVNAWMILGLLKMHKADKAYDIFKRITPGYYRGENDPKRKCPAYIYANCYYGPDHRNNKFQMEFTWITGSIAWYQHLLMNDLLGVKADYEGLRIKPCIPSEWDKYEVIRFFRNATYNIVVNNPDHLQHGNVNIIVDGKEIIGDILPVYNDGKIHEVEVKMMK
ncbi:MAG: hypothetical protein HPY74_10260 [Firmicutes bacterium]|nr:hypothetical protein [Bacillota bacterium]